MTCWQCNSDIKLGTLLCPHCGTLQPPAPGLTHFQRLGVPGTFRQDADAVITRHRSLQRQVHPDRFASATALVRRLSIEHATAINDALRIIRDPMRRAFYCLKLKGVDIDDERSGIKLDPLFLMKIIELREAISELRGDDAHVERAQMEREVALWYEETLERLGQRLDGAESGADDLSLLAQDAAQLKYLRRALDDIQAEGN